MYATPGCGGVTLMGGLWLSTELDVDRSSVDERVAVAAGSDPDHGAV
jgi:hypothetical protein